MKKVLHVLILTCISGHGISQHLDSISEKFDRHRKNFLREKVYVHSDNDLYLAGEYMWLKPYLVDGAYHRPTDASKVVYVELLDENNEPVLQAKLPTATETGETSVYLPATIETGNYLLRAYTNLMKNASPDFFFHKPITVINTFRKRDSTATNTRPGNYHCQLFPEGGNLIAGLPNKVGFKITDTGGRGLRYSGWITDWRNDTIAAFSPLRYGLGHFYMTPLVDKPYRVYVRDSLGNVRAFPFPEVQRSGYLLSVQDSLERYLKVKVDTRNMSSGKVVYLFVHARNIISVSAVGRLENNAAVFTIDKQTLLEGISHFTVFDEELNPRCERLYFKPVSGALQLSVDHDGTFNLRERVDLRINAASGGKPVVANLSMSVAMGDELGGAPSQGMQEYLWLTSELPGLVEHPEFYFSNHPEVSQAADNLMLTHGWRRFKWKEILTGRPPALKFLPEYYGHVISGSVSSNSPDKVSGVLTSLSSPDTVARLYVSRSNQAGNVYFQTRGLYGPRRLIVQTQPSAYTFTINNPFATGFSKIDLPPVYLNRSAANVLRDRSVAMQVRYLYGTNVLPALQSAADSIPFYGVPDDSYRLDAYTRFPVMEEVMREYVPKVRVRQSEDGFRFLLTDLVNETVFREDPLVLLDGVPISADEILKFDPRKVERLDVVARRYFLGALTTPGIVSYLTYTGDMGGFEIDPGVVSIDYQGLEEQTEFYSPMYSSEQLRSSRVPDYRRLLHWTSRASTGGEGVFESSFYTSDLPGRYFIVVEALTNDGRTGRVVSGFSVKR